MPSACGADGLRQNSFQSIQDQAAGTAVLGRRADVHMQTLQPGWHELFRAGAVSEPPLVYRVYKADMPVRGGMPEPCDPG